MAVGESSSRVALVTGAGGQDGYFLASRLLGEGSTVHAVVRSSAPGLDELAQRHGGRLHLARVDLHDGDALADALRAERPTEIYNLAGASSVSASFHDPHGSWRTNAQLVVTLLEAVRRHAPESRLYQAASSEMFGCPPGGSVVHDESSPLAPQSPYGAGKAAAYMMCRAYRDAYGVRVACGILFNHESRRRPPAFLTRKVADHVRALQASGASGRGRRAPLTVGNLKVERDWGFAPDFVDGIVRIARQIDVRAATSGGPREPDEARHYRDYLLCTGRLHAVWELIDRAFALTGFALEWQLAGDDPRSWSAHFADGGEPAVVVDERLLRPADPVAIGGDPSKAVRELGWTPQPGLDRFLEDMLDGSPPVQPVAPRRPPRDDARAPSANRG